MSSDAATVERVRYRVTVLGHYDARLPGNEPHVTVNFLAGPGDNLVYCGTLTMAEAEWGRLRRVLARGLRDDFEVDDFGTANEPNGFEPGPG